MYESKTLSSHQVADWFAGRCQAQWQNPEGFEWEPGFFPVSTESFARQPFAWRSQTEQAPVLKGLEDEGWSNNEVRVWNADDFGEGDMLWRVSSTGTLHVFRCEGCSEWEHIRAEPGYGPVATEWGTFVYTSGSWWLGSTW